jgi:carbohydrate kinase (thermoresistant glucokinase family)
MNQVNDSARIVVLMGVSGSGKSTIGRLLSQRLGWPFHDGDDFHPPGNVAKMHAGVALDDEDRRPWLAAIADSIRDHLRRGERAIYACSALKQAYRAMLKVDERVVFVHLRAERAVLEARLRSRRGHYMPASLLDSQLATLQDPGAEAIEVDVSPPAEQVAEAICRRLGV